MEVVEKVENAVIPADVHRIVRIRISVVGMAFAVPFIVEFWRSLGLTMSTILLIQVAFQSVWLLMDVPLGYLADAWGRRKVILLGAVGLTAGGVCYACATDVLGVVLAELLLAIGLACITGADEALLRSALRANDQEDLFKRWWGYAQSAEMAAGTLGCLLGGALYLVHPRLPFAGAIGCYLVLLWQAYSLDYDLIERDHVRGHLRQLWVLGTGAIFRKPRLSWLMFTSGFGLAILQVMFWFQPDYLKQAGIAVVNNSWIYAAMGLFASSLGVWASRRVWNVSRRRFASMMFVLQAVCLLGLSLISGWWGLFFLAGTQVTRGLIRVVLADWVRREAHHAEHATISSLRGAIYRSYFIVLALGLSFFADVWQAQDALRVLGIIVVVLGLFLVALCPRFNDFES